MLNWVLNYHVMKVWHSLRAMGSDLSSEQLCVTTSDAVQALTPLSPRSPTCYNGGVWNSAGLGLAEAPCTHLDLPIRAGAAQNSRRWPMYLGVTLLRTRIRGDLH